MRVFISDLHLDAPGTPAFDTFASLMQVESQRCEAIYILGDLCEVWVGDDDDGPLAMALREVLCVTTASCRVGLVHGNRDFLFGERFARETGVELLGDPTRLDDGTLLAHGDGFCVDDEAYQRVRETLRSPAWQAGVLAMSLEARRDLAAGMREDSLRTNANKAANIMDVSASEVARVVGDAGAHQLIHGHTHRPGAHPCDWGMRYVLGAWERCGWLLRMKSDSAPELECFPLTGRYGI